MLGAIVREYGKRRVTLGRCHLCCLRQAAVQSLPTMRMRDRAKGNFSSKSVRNPIVRLQRRGSAVDGCRLAQCRLIYGTIDPRQIRLLDEFAQIAKQTPPRPSEPRSGAYAVSANP